MKKFTQLIIIVPLLFFCTKKDTSDGVVKIGSTVITKEQHQAFKKIVRMYPTDPGSFFPNIRSTISHLIETEVLYDKAISRSFKDSIKKTDDWKWKQRYYPAQLYLLDFLGDNLGVTEEKITAYYEANKDSFKVTVSVNSNKKDSTVEDSTETEETKKDSVYYKELSEVRNQIIERLFLEENAPDSAFLATYDSLPEEKELTQQWIRYVRQKIPEYFMKKAYKEKTGSPYPDSLDEVFGDGKIITPADLDVILSWIPESRRKMYEKPDRKRELVEWLLKWKLFSEIVEKTGRNQLPLVKNVLVWGWKLNVVYAYMNNVIEAQAEAAVTVDTAMAIYAYYDDNGYKKFPVESQQFKNKLSKLMRDAESRYIDSVIIHYRRTQKITFLQSDWTDDKNEDPASLIAKANALRDSGKTTEAKSAYLDLSKTFPFTPEGQTSLIEMAKIQTEQQLYTQAIRNYRDFLLTSNDHSKRCNTFFMIGFIYDEYLNKPLHAEYNYKWVLKNTPECELADDAEFMMLHLSEPMSSVEELRDEAQRQGREVEEDEPQTTASADSSGK